MIYLLLIAYQLKHFLADYPLQGRFMLGKFLPYPKFIVPLLAHSLVHGLFTFGIALFFKDPSFAALLGLLDMGIHFLVDRIKASPSMLGRFKPLSAGEYLGVEQMASYKGENSELNLSKKLAQDKLKSNVFFWWALGADQMAHHLTHYFIIWSLL